MTSKKPRKPPKLFKNGQEWEVRNAEYGWTWYRLHLPGYCCDVTKLSKTDDWKAEFSLVGGVAAKEKWFKTQKAAVAWLREQVIARHEETAAIIGGGL